MKCTALERLARMCVCDLPDVLRKYVHYQYAILVQGGGDSPCGITASERWEVWRHARTKQTMPVNDRYGD